MLLLLICYSRKDKVESGFSWPYVIVYVLPISDGCVMVAMVANINGTTYYGA